MGPLAPSWSNPRHAVTAIDPHAIHTVDEVDHSSHAENIIPQRSI